MQCDLKTISLVLQKQFRACLPCFSLSFRSLFFFLYVQPTLFGFPLFIRNWSLQQLLVFVECTHTYVCMRDAGQQK